MKFTHLQRKTVSLIVLAAFVGLLHCWSMPAQAATRANSSETAIAQGGGDGPNFIEAESGKTPAISKGKKFPWLFVGLGVVVVGVALYFLVIKKPKYTLSVTLGSNCSGTPAATTSYTKGTVVNYNYTAAAGNIVHVKLDGADVAASGTITMDKDKALTVSAEALDIRGTWGVNFTGSSGLSSFVIVFTGTKTNGTWKLIGYTDTGTYVVSGVDVAFVFNGAPWTFTGKFETNNRMTGNHSWPAIGLSGTWTGIRQGTAAAEPALPAAGFGTSLIEKILNK
jgi:hypothetical protein